MKGGKIDSEAVIAFVQKTNPNDAALIAAAREISTICIKISDPDPWVTRDFRNVEFQNPKTHFVFVCVCFSDANTLAN